VHLPSRDIRVLLIDEHQLVRHAVRLLLEREADLRIVGDVGSHADALTLIAAEQPDVIVFEPESMAGDDLASEQIHEIVAAAPGGRVLILTAIRDPQRYTRFLAYGALGVVLKHHPSAVLIKAIRKLHEGELWLERASAAQLLRFTMLRRRQENEHQTRIRSLTKREREIVTLLCDGISNANLADRLFISEATVRNHLTSILHKLNVTNRFELVVFSYRHGIVKPDVERHELLASPSEG
jgi:two-component system, NarL family, nitrate/nitrite response regulator NarL